MGVKRDKIGFIIDNIDKSWAQSVWPSFAKNALRLKLNLYIFPGGRLDSYCDSDNLRNSVFSLATTENLDGLICINSSLKDKVSLSDEFLRFHTNLEPLPYVTVADKIPGHPCVGMDCYTGMKQLITHCIEVHGARKIAFLRGPTSHPHAQERFKAYEDAMNEAGLPLIRDNPLVTDPFVWEEGDAAAAQLFQERKLKPGKDFDTLVGADDELIIKAIRYFAKHGYHVSRDYHATGFDNSVECLLCESPVSTVKVPYSKIGSEAFRVLLKHMGEDNAPGFGPVEDVLLPSVPVIRESCGCGFFQYHNTDRVSAVILHESREEALTAKIADYLELNARETKSFVTPVIRSWYKIPREGNSGAHDPLSGRSFLNCFERAILRFISTERESEILFRLLNDILHSGLVSASQFWEFEPAMLQIIFKLRERAIISSQFRSDHIKVALDSFKFELLETKDSFSLVECLARHLPKIGIETAGLVLYGDDENSLWVGSYSPEGLSPIKGQYFPVRQLVPESQKSLFSQGAFVVQPLFFEDRSLGYFIHTVSNYDGIIYEDIRNTVNYALKNISRLEEVVRAQQKVLEGMEQSRILTLQKEAAQAASEAKSQFLASVSHEIRTPMNAILGMSELMLSENLNTRHRQYVDDIRTSAMALLDIINQILDLSKIQSGKMSLIPVHYDFKALMENISSMIRFLIKNNDVVFNSDIHGDIPQYLYGDNVRLRQILLNLLGNAVKFTKEGFIHLSVAVTDTDIHFTVKDTGIGIRKEDLAGLFEAFKQLDPLKNRDNKGTGLGLTITKLLVEMMNGTIDVESEYGKGTTFHVVIPKVPGDETLIQHFDSGGRVLCSPDTRILIVDDNHLNLTVISGLLQLCGITAFSATSGRQAIEMMRQNQYDLVFMDHMMPEMDGVEALKIIRTMDINTPVIALTANALTSAKEMLLAAGMNDFLAKPIMKEELHEILVKWIPGAKLVDSQTVEAEAEAGNSGLHENTKFRERLAGVAGISVKVGLERVSGQMEVYENILKSLIGEIEKCTGKLNGFMAENDMHNFAIEAHSMKSSLANVGAMELSAKAYELEIASSRNDSAYCASNLRPFADELHHLGKELSEVFAGLHQNGDTVVLSPELSQILTKMKIAVSEVKYEEINIELEKLENQNLDGSLEDEIEELRNAIIIMDYDSALEKIRNLLH